ncbi:Superoxide dismutase Ni-type [Thiorhodococcus drewsii AZ1]|uniref:Superoxide dismutase Ni-type n=1 Tax=Thiorhodococcus drewsii AZ1 TaxID=765913 RepID=G2E466_9GAMM|nr:superoxide dismutase [Ni] [Thiorhodococcus drewsii]EGV29793.1 Superoxide dismutase Ni-type [Thiorhodococcus drewsii AZ1]
MMTSPLRENVDAHPQPATADQAQLMRLVAEKERHAEVVKVEVRVVWGDYFKAPPFEQIPGVHDSGGRSVGARWVLG